MNRFLCLHFFLLLTAFSIGSAASTDLKIVTFNVRYDSRKDGANNWENRKTNLVEYINSLNADIVCMQEVLNRQQVYLTKIMPQYDYVVGGSRDGMLKGEMCPIFYNKTKFKLIDYGHFWLSEMPDSAGSIGWDAKSPHIVTWIKLKITKTISFFVINSHFDWNSNLSRKNSAKLILNWIRDNVADEPVIVTGDFNASPQSDTYIIMNTSGIVRDSYLLASKRTGVGYSFHDFNRLPVEKRKILDYVFVSNDIKVRKVDIFEEMLKNNCYLSDHNPVIVDITFKNK